MCAEAEHNLDLKQICNCFIIYLYVNIIEWLDGLMWSDERVRPPCLFWMYKKWKNKNYFTKLITIIRTTSIRVHRMCNTWVFIERRNQYFCGDKKSGWQNRLANFIKHSTHSHWNFWGEKIICYFPRNEKMIHHVNSFQWKYLSEWEATLAIMYDYKSMFAAFDIHRMKWTDDQIRSRFTYKTEMTWYNT